MVQVLNFPRKCVYLIGARASGKSTVGRLLAARLNWPLAETDALAEEILGASISRVVSEQGWRAFREAEGLALKQAASLEPAVISTGGGIVLSDENREFMNKTGLIVYLRASPELLEKRLWDDAGARPSLTGVHPAKEIAQVLADREELYRELAHLTVDVERSAEEICKHIYAILLMRGAKGNLLKPVHDSSGSGSADGSGGMDDPDDKGMMQ